MTVTKLSTPLLRAWHKTDHPLWVGMQFAVSRVLTAVKYLLIARLLGPEAMGHIGVALLALAALEALTDLGLGQAIVQHASDLNPTQRRTTWTVLLLRGAGISLLLAAVAPLLAHQFHAPEALPLLYLCALVPLVRNAVSIQAYVAQRDRDFRIGAWLTVIPAAVDFAVSLGLTLLLGGPAGLFLGMLVGEALRVLLSFVVFRDFPRPQLDLGSVRALNAYGRWIWATSLLTFFLNQLDKFVAGTMFGPYALGQYQTASRTAQLGVSDIASAASQYLFPTFASQFRSSPKVAWNAFRKIMGATLLLTVATTTIFWVCSQFIIALLLGQRWVDIAPVFRILALNMGFGANIAILVAYMRATGRPEHVTRATVLQCALYIPLVFTLPQNYGTLGLAVSATAGTFTTMVYLLYWALPSRQQTRAS